MRPTKPRSPHRVRREDSQKNSATISALPRRVIPCSRASCSAMARSAHDSGACCGQTAPAAASAAVSPPLVSKITTQRAAGPPAQARGASKPRPTQPNPAFPCLSAHHEAAYLRRRSGWTFALRLSSSAGVCWKVEVERRFLFLWFEQSGSTISEFQIFYFQIYVNCYVCPSGMATVMSSVC
jgi:hypothetical protein